MYISCILFLVSCILYLVSFILYLVSFILYRVYILVCFSQHLCLHECPLKRGSRFVAQLIPNCCSHYNPPHSKHHGNQKKSSFNTTRLPLEGLITPSGIVKNLALSKLGWPPNQRLKKLKTFVAAFYVQNFSGKSVVIFHEIISCKVYAFVCLRGTRTNKNTNPYSIMKLWVLQSSER